MTSSIPAASVPAGSVGKAGPWTVAHRKDGSLRAVSSRCRHQLADLSQGSLDKDGCLVCPWHGARYDLDSGAMVQGPRGFLWYVGKTPGYTQAIKAYAAVLRLRTRSVERRDGQLVVGDE
jgi:nitrite reductase/ring-hydroxylating ferredoxin subunit